MKLLTTLRTFKNQWLARINHERFIYHGLEFTALSLAAGIIWFYGPQLRLYGFNYLAAPEKRLYIIAAIYLIWILKILIIDLVLPKAWRYKNPEARHQINALTKRFQSVMQFLRDKKIRQQDTSWQILIGPANAGKTALLAHSHAPFILQRQFKPTIPEHFQANENCDWWLTRQGGLIEVPSHYLFGKPTADKSKKGIHTLLWNCFLSLLKKQGGKRNITGIVIAVPIVEWVDQPLNESLATLAKVLARHVQDIQHTLDKKLPCHFVMTKCDLIPGFNEFFTESADDEILQPWGISLPRAQTQDEFEEHFTNRFNALIKKINQQLLWRLHHERNPMARPYVKNFPLQLEKIKDFIGEFAKELNSGSRRPTQPIYVQGIYLTSALQAKPEPETTIHADINHENRTLQIFKEPTNKSRAFFIKQLITDTLFPTKVNVPNVTYPKGYSRYVAIAASTLVVIGATVIMGYDFQAGLEKNQQVKHELVEYQNGLQQFHNPDENMLKTLALLDMLKKSMQADATKSPFQRIMNYFTDKSHQNAGRVYRHALQVFLLPEIRNYFGDYLRNPINKDIDKLYNVLKAYLMLGDASHFDALFVKQTIMDILPENFNSTAALTKHLDLAVGQFQPITLNAGLIGETRKYLGSLRGIQLSYTILKTLDSNVQQSSVLASILNFNSTKRIPLMFTSRNFAAVYDSEIQTAAHEAATGNWILGKDFRPSMNPTYAAELTEELRNEYVRNYTDTWESAIENIQLDRPRDLQQADAMIMSLTSYDSPLLKLLTVIYENTSFTPIAASSNKLQTIGQLVDKRVNSQQELYSLLTSLQGLHEYLQPVLSAPNPKEAAFKLISDRMQHQGAPDPLTRLRMAADQSPAPIKNWINQLSNDTWHFLLKNAMHYMDTSWTEKVAAPFQEQMADHYPFKQEANSEVAVAKFTHFFGKPGVILSFYNRYLTPFVDTSKPEWTWKKLDGEELPFSANVLHQIQQAVNIHHSFFPNDDDSLYVPFALQQQKLANNIAQIKLNMNNKIIVDDRNKPNSPYVMAWPHDLEGKQSSIQLTIAGKKPIELDYPGAWGWFRLVNETFISKRSNKEIILNLAKENGAAQYVLSTQSKTNPFIALNLQNFTLEQKLTTMTA